MFLNDLKSDLNFVTNLPTSGCWLCWDYWIETCCADAESAVLKTLYIVESELLYCIQGLVELEQQIIETIAKCSFWLKTICYYFKP